MTIAKVAPNWARPTKLTVASRRTNRFEREDVSNAQGFSGGQTMAFDKSIEEGTQFSPSFNNDGLIPVIAQDAKTSEVLIFAYMNKQALQQTIQTGLATYYSRSRKKLWTKGEQSGHSQKVEQILIDCDQDCVLLKVSVDAGQCHVGYQSCFYRRLKAGSSRELEFVAEKVYDPRQTYKT